eukprot:GFUD01041721.1.p1 GENE.GFUD01041721.1~~GFUD01041721.1.p1  ORF type:complete len:489 (+),score=124.43 GFUD01041721.1:77-1543(+)
MFGILPAGVKITEHFDDFNDESLLEPKPVKNWPKLFGKLASAAIKNNVQKDTTSSNVLVVNGGAGRSTLELLRSCDNLLIDHADSSTDHVRVLDSLLKESRISWDQPIEGKIVKKMSFALEAEESVKDLVGNKGNSVSYIHADIKDFPADLARYNIIVADLRHKNAAEDIKILASFLDKDGLLILGSIDDVDEDNPGQTHSCSSLTEYFDRIALNDNDACFSHIYRETRNKHQYAISYFSVWRMKSQVQSSETDPRDDEKCPETTEDYYEDQSILASYDIFHFGDGLLNVKNFPLRMSEVCVEACQKFKTNFKLALDAGCGPGRTAMELCSAFEQVKAYDYSQGFVDNMLSKAGEKGLTNLTACAGDSHKQNEIYKNEKFDLIFGCNLIDRLHTPQQWIQHSKDMLADSGLLIIASPYTWKPEHTKVENWLGGFVKEGKQMFTVEGLKDQLCPELVLLDEQRVPFVIPDPDGTFQYTYSNCTIFGKKR